MPKVLGVPKVRQPGVRTGATDAHYAGTWRSGIGAAEKNRRQGAAIMRAHRADRFTRALSVAIPVFAYIWRYSFEIITNATRAFIDLTHFERSQIFGRL